MFVQLNSTLTVRRNIFHALLHSISVGLIGIRRVFVVKEPTLALEAVAELLPFAARVARCNQRSCLRLSPCDMGASSTMLEAQEVVWLGWTALSTILPRNCVSAIQVAEQRKQRIWDSGLLPVACLSILQEACSSKGFASRQG